MTTYLRLVREVTQVFEQLDIINNSHTTVIPILWRESVVTFGFGFGLVWFSDISTILGYLMSNPVFTYISNILFVNIFRYAQLNKLTVLFKTIQLIMSYLFARNLNVKQFYLTHRWDPISCYHSRSE